MKKLVSFLSPLLLSLACSNVDVGHVGLMVNKCDGTISEVGIGYHNTGGPCTHLIEYPTYRRTYVLSHSVNEGNTTTDDSVNVSSSDGMNVNMDVALSYAVGDKKAVGIYTKFRADDLVDLEKSYFRQVIRDTLQETVVEWTAEQVNTSKKAAIRAEAEQKLKTKLGADGFDVFNFALNEVRVPKEITDAINQKVVMTQSAQKAEASLRLSRAQAEATKIAAEGAAESAKKKADADAYANEKLSRSLTPQLVEYLKIMKWDGHLSQVSGGGGTLINMGPPGK